MLKKKKVNNIKILKRKEIDLITGCKIHQGVFLKCNLIQTYSISDIKKTEELILILDSLNDSQNVGSIIRTAYLFGVKTIIFNKNNSFKINPFLIKSASGAYEKIKLIETMNINRTIEYLKKINFWIIGLDPKALNSTENISKDLKKAVILGSEEKGIRRLIKDNCDFLVKISTTIDDDEIIDSLNVSSACAIILNQFSR